MIRSIAFYFSLIVGMWSSVAFSQEATRPKRETKQDQKLMMPQKPVIPIPDASPNPDIQTMPTESIFDRENFDHSPDERSS